MDGLEGTGYTGGQEPEGSSERGNPAWNDFLSVIPEELHEKVTPVLQKWDQGVNDRFNKVHSEWEDWKPIREQYSVKDVQWGTQLAQALAADPKRTWESIAEHYGFNSPSSGQGQGEPQNGNVASENEDPYSPRLSELENRLEMVSKALLAKHQAEELQAADRQIELELKAAREKHGDFDPEYVTALMTTGMSADAAAAKYRTLVETTAKQFKPPLPSFLGGGGGTAPGNQSPDPRKMNSTERSKYVVDLLNSYKAQND